MTDREERKKHAGNFIMNSESDKDIHNKEELRGGKRYHCALLTEGDTLALLRKLHIQEIQNWHFIKKMIE